MVAPAVEGLDLFKIAGRAIAGWIPSFKMGAASHVRQRCAVALVSCESPPRVSHFLPGPMVGTGSRRVG